MIKLDQEQEPERTGGIDLVFRTIGSDMLPWSGNYFVSLGATRLARTRSAECYTITKISTAQQRTQDNRKYGQNRRLQRCNMNDRFTLNQQTLRA
jgi:hypothetical protein